MKYHIDEDEVYPDYSLRRVLDTGFDFGIDLTDEFVERYEKAAKEYNEVQTLLGVLVEVQDAKFEEWFEANRCKVLQKDGKRCGAWPDPETGECKWPQLHFDYVPPPPPPPPKPVFVAPDTLAEPDQEYLLFNIPVDRVIPDAFVTVPSGAKVKGTDVIAFITEYGA